MMITSDEDFDIDSMEYKGSNKGILEILNQKKPTKKEKKK